MILKIYKLNTYDSDGIAIPNWIVYTCIAVIFSLGTLTGIIIGSSQRTESSELTYADLLDLINTSDSERVSPSQMFEYMEKIGIKYPEIVWSQVALETRFCSKVSKENNNYFGMKRAGQRPNTQCGKNLNHAVYKNWKLSVIDYSIWQSTVGLANASSEEEYYSYLRRRYAEDSKYVDKVKTIREEFNLYLEKYDSIFYQEKKCESYNND